jgi:hypothetical protein
VPKVFERECVNAMLGRSSITRTGPENLRSLTCTMAGYEAARKGTTVEIS